MGDDPNYIVGFKYKTSDFQNFSGSSFFSHNGKLMNAHLKSFSSRANLKTNTAYEFINTNSDERLNSNIENLHFLSEYKFNESSHINFNIRHDLTQNKTADYVYGLGAELGFWKYTLE